jgi:putative ABC transport system permease protein
VLTLLALILSLLFIWLFIPDFNEFTGKGLNVDVFFSTSVFLPIVGIALLIGLLSGSYPAFFLSSFQPAAVLKGNFSKSGRGNSILRKILVSLQFFIAVFMIISALIVSGQLNFLRDKDLGYSAENIVVVQISDDGIRDQIDAFINEIVQNPNIISASNSHGIPGITPWLRTMRIESDEGMQDEPLLYLEIDYNFVSTYDLDIRQGRNFSKAMGTDSLEAVLINETAAYKFGWLDAPLGKRIHFGFNQEGSGGRMLKVIGMVDDFNFWSLHNPIEPIILFIQNDPGNLLSIKISDQNKEGTLFYLSQKWRDFGADYPFRYEYLTEKNNEMYIAESRTGQIITVGAILTIILSLLGLMGLSSFVAEQKTREVGIRKVHGASVRQILMLLYKDFLYLFLLAFILAAPIAWWRLDIWLETEFAFYKEINSSVFLLGGLAAIFMGLMAISFFILRAAYSDPVKTIKYE